MIGFRGAHRYMREADLFGLELDAIAPRLGRRPREPPRHAAVRAHRARARALPRLVAESGLARPAAASSSG